MEQKCGGDVIEEALHRSVTLSRSMEFVPGEAHALHEWCLPLIEGEWAHEGGYHYYPAVLQVRQWTRMAGFTTLEELDGDAYQHFTVQRNRVPILVAGLFPLRQPLGSLLAQLSVGLDQHLTSCVAPKIR